MVPRPGFSLLLLAAFCVPAPAGESYGPVRASVARVIDGDTLEADARVWPGHTVRVAVRIRGIDAPETRSRCVSEKEAGERARHALSELVAGGTVIISNVSGGKYYGRIVADVETDDGRSVSAELLDRSLVRSYAGGRRVPFCDTAETMAGSIP